jgi:glutathione synthase/RimK-type ligase-like ATP-grasp enzyme
MDGGAHITAKNRFFIAAVISWAERRGAHCERHFGDWLVMVTYNGITRFLEWYDVGLNSSANYLIAKDKCGTTWILERHAVSAVEHFLVLRPDSQGWTTAQAAAQAAFVARVGFPIVLKPNTGTNGNDVYKVDSTEELDETLTTLFATERAVALSPFIKVVKEYRATVLDGEVLLMYAKLQDTRADFRFNLSHGATVAAVDGEEFARVSPIAKLTMRFANVDIVLDESGALSVLEVNGGVAFEKYSLISDAHRREAQLVYDRALDTLFGILPQ